MSKPDKQTPAQQPDVGHLAEVVEGFMKDTVMQGDLDPEDRVHLREVLQNALEEGPKK